jgi:hypothetical protein
MFNNLKIRIKTITTKLFSKKEQKPGFVNPYGMTNTTTSAARPVFKDGKIVFPQRGGKQIQQNGMQTEIKKEPESKKKKERPDSSVVKSILEVIIADLEDVSGETERRRKRAEKERIDKDTYQHFLELARSKGEK